MSVSEGSVVRARCNDQCAPDGATNTAGTTCQHQPTRPEGGPMPTMVPHATDEQSRSGNERADDAATIRRLQTLLAAAIDIRDELLARGFDGLPPAERHWFVNDSEGYCQACALPWANSRHVERTA